MIYCASYGQQIEQIVGKHGLVVISREGSNPESFIYESDVLTKYKVSVILHFNYSCQLGKNQALHII